MAFNYRQRTPYTTNGVSHDTSNGNSDNYQAGNYLNNNEQSTAVNVIVRTVRKADRDGKAIIVDYSTYTPNHWNLDLNRGLRKFGIRIPYGWFSDMWVVNDWSGWLGVLTTWFFIFFGEGLLLFFVVIRFAYPVYAWVNMVFSVICASLGFIAHWKATFMDPVSHLYFLT